MDTILLKKMQSGKLNKNEIHLLNSEISQYRLLAMKKGGAIRKYCNWQANFIERKLKESGYE